MSIETITKNKCFNGIQGVYSHYSETCGCNMRFSLFAPIESVKKSCPAVFWLSGLTCTEENFTFKAGAQKYAAEFGLILIAPDTSPRGLNIPGEDDDYDFGTGAGFYLNATQKPWTSNYNMYNYITRELHDLVINNFPIAKDKIAISGHSMGGHGALTIGIKNPDVYKSVSAFSPIVTPMTVPWGIKAFTGYLGTDKKVWEKYDTISLLQNGRSHTKPLLVDQGQNDQFLQEQLKPEALIQACNLREQELIFRLHSGYDHSYSFIATFIGEHLKFHYEHLSN